MPGKTLVVVLQDALADLGQEDFIKFRSRLVDRRDEPRVRRNRVDNKSVLDVSDVMVSTFTEPEAVRVAVELLTSMGCNQEAKNLAEEAAKVSSPEADDRKSSASGPASVPHFVDQNRLALTERVTNIPPILDRLLDRGVVSQDFYERVLALPIHQDQMRALFSGPLTAGIGAKDIFYEVLKEQERFLMEDLSQ